MELRGTEGGYIVWSDVRTVMELQPLGMDYNLDRKAGTVRWLAISSYWYQPIATQFSDVFCIQVTKNGLGLRDVVLSVGELEGSLHG